MVEMQEKIILTRDHITALIEDRYKKAREINDLVRIVDVVLEIAEELDIPPEDMKEYMSDSLIERMRTEEARLHNIKDVSNATSTIDEI